MYEKFGEFDSVEEINKAAAGFKAEGDTESLIAFAKENGIDEFDTEDYIAGEIPELASVFSAVLGKLDKELEEINQIKQHVEKMPHMIIMEQVKGMVTDEKMAVAVMRKGKRVKEIFSAMRSEAEKHKSGNMGISCGTDRQLREVIKTYYIGTSEELKEKLASLYK